MKVNIHSPKILSGTIYVRYQSNIHNVFKNFYSIYFDKIYTEVKFIYNQNILIILFDFRNIKQIY